MAYCGPRGIPLSAFLGWEQSDQDAALVWQKHEADRCPSCGTHPDDGPRHHHVNVCPNCVSLHGAGASDDAKVPGAHVVTTPGTRANCPRCAAERQANAPRR